LTSVKGLPGKGFGQPIFSQAVPKPPLIHCKLDLCKFALGKPLPEIFSEGNPFITPSPQAIMLKVKHPTNI
jgi:hypothetical protein